MSGQHLTRDQIKERWQRGITVCRLALAALTGNGYLQYRTPADCIEAAISQLKEYIADNDARGIRNFQRRFGQEDSRYFRVVSMGEVADMLGVTKATMSNYIKKGVCPPYTIRSNRYVFLYGEVLKWMQKEACRPTKVKPGPRVKATFNRTAKEKDRRATMLAKLALASIREANKGLLSPETPTADKETDQ